MMSAGSTTTSPLGFLLFFGLSSSPLAPPPPLTRSRARTSPRYSYIHEDIHSSSHTHPACSPSIDACAPRALPHGGCALTHTDIQTDTGSHALAAAVIVIIVIIFSCLPAPSAPPLPPGCALLPLSSSAFLHLHLQFVHCPHMQTHGQRQPFFQQTAGTAVWAATHHPNRLLGRLAG